MQRDNIIYALKRVAMTAFAMKFPRKADLARVPYKDGTDGTGYSLYIFAKTELSPDFPILLLAIML